MLKGFRDFVLRGNIVELAIAFVLGVAFSAVVSAFSNDFIGGLIGAIGGTPNFNNAGVTINDSKIVYGSTVTASINFVIVAAVIYFVIVVPMNALAARRKRGEDDGPPPPEDIQLLTEIRDLLKNQT
jgi:large conductance mechanosensitive channel